MEEELRLGLADMQEVISRGGWMDIGVRAGDADVKDLGISKVLQITLIEGVVQGENTDREGSRTDARSC